MNLNIRNKVLLFSIFMLVPSMVVAQETEKDEALINFGAVINDVSNSNNLNIIIIGMVVVILILVGAAMFAPKK